MKHISISKPPRFNAISSTNAQYEEFIRQTGKLVPAIMGWEVKEFPRVLKTSGHGCYMEWLWGLSMAHRENRAPVFISDGGRVEKACRAGKPSIRGMSLIGALQLQPARSPRSNIIPNKFDCFDFVGNVRQWTCTLWEKVESCRMLNVHTRGTMMGAMI
jgi:formylglycine-generating enzyme required for sulfatase activity